MKYRMLVKNIAEDMVNIPEGAIPVTVMPNYQTNLWMLIYLVPVEESTEEKSTKEGSKED